MMVPRYLGDNNSLVSSHCLFTYFKMHYKQLMELVESAKLVYSERASQTVATPSSSSDSSGTDSTSECEDSTETPLLNVAAPEFVPAPSKTLNVNATTFTPFMQSSP